MNRRSLLLSAAALGACSTLPRGGDVLAITNAKIYSAPNAPPIENGTIFVRDGRIAAVETDIGAPEGARVIDAAGGAVTAGFWNSHIHVFTHELLHAGQKSDAELTATLDAMLNRWGFTSVFDVASILANTNNVRQRIRAAAIRGPNILTVGEPFFPLNGTPIYIRQFLRSENISFPEIASVEQAAAQAQRQIDEGADGLKLFAGAIVGGPVGVLPMQIEVARAVVDVAHRAGKPVFAHPSNLAGLNVSIESGVDVLTHAAAMAGPWSPELIQRLRAHNLALTPTLELFEIDRPPGEPSEAAAQDVALAQGQMAAYASAGGEVLFGTDVGYTQAFSTAREFALMQGAGFDFPAILTSLTTAPARRFGFAERKGRIARGMDADLVILQGDPAADLGALSRVRQTIRGGEIIYGAAAAA
ncbi:MAG TPA: amidohydrolase family protein [Vitreimonas sp.]|nr:amidohydrolase family protein [Vitreimonas sp.]